jgi:zinc protease
MFAGHPYAHTPIGTREDLERMSRDDLLSYYRTYYVPNNATLVVVGDVYAADVLERSEEVFAPISIGNPVQPPPFFPIPQQCEQRFEIVQDINLKRLQIGYHVPGIHHSDKYALDIIEHVLSHGKTSRFYQRLVDQEQLVTFADAYYHARKAAGVFHLFAELRPGCSPKQVEMILDEEIARLRTTPVAEDELSKVKHVIAADIVFERETTIGLAHVVGEYAVSHTHEEVNAYASRIDAVTSEEIVRVANDYLLPERRTVGWAFPEHPEKERQTIIVPDEPVSPVPTEMVF